MHIRREWGEGMRRNKLSEVEQTRPRELFVYTERMGYESIIPGPTARREETLAYYIQREPSNPLDPREKKHLQLNSAWLRSCASCCFDDSRCIHCFAPKFAPLHTHGPWVWAGIAGSLHDSFSCVSTFFSFSENNPQSCSIGSITLPASTFQCSYHSPLAPSDLE